MLSEGNAVDVLLRDMMRRELTPCAKMAVMRQNRLVYSFAEGYERLDRRDTIAVDGQTQFNIGSVTKPVTASLIMKLAEMGRLKLEDPVKEHIPEFQFDDIHDDYSNFRKVCNTVMASLAV